MVTISLFLYPETAFATKDDFLWALGRSIVVGALGIPLNNLSKTAKD